MPAMLIRPATSVVFDGASVTPVGASTYLTVGTPSAPALGTVLRG